MEKKNKNLFVKNHKNSPKYKLLGVVKFLLFKIPLSKYTIIPVTKNKERTCLINVTHISYRGEC